MRSSITGGIAGLMVGRHGPGSIDGEHELGSADNVRCSRAGYGFKPVRSTGSVYADELSSGSGTRPFVEGHLDGKAYELMMHSSASSMIEITPESLTRSGMAIAPMSGLTASIIRVTLPQHDFHVFA